LLAGGLTWILESVNRTRTSNQRTFKRSSRLRTTSPLGVSNQDLGKA
jgi:hypothetical protein